MADFTHWRTAGQQQVCLSCLLLILLLHSRPGLLHQLNMQCTMPLHLCGVTPVTGRAVLLAVKATAVHEVSSCISSAVGVHVSDAPTW